MTHDNTNTQTFRKTSTYAMVVTALMAAVTCILAPLSVPIGPVPISLTNFAIYLSPVSYTHLDVYKRQRYIR